MMNKDYQFVTVSIKIIFLVFVYDIIDLLLSLLGL